MSATGSVVDFIASTRFADFPDKAIVEAKRCILDGLGVILAGSTAPCSAILRKQIEVSGGREEASILGERSLKAPASLAARANGTSGHAHDFDDTQLSRFPDRVFGLLTHPTIPALAPVLALGEREGVSGASALEAFLTGFEVECKMAEAIHPGHYQKGFHSSGTLGTFGAVAAAAKILALSPGPLAHALGIAASMASGIRVSFGTMTKPLHVGRASENGVVAAELAGLGYTAGAEALDGPWGFFQVLGGGFDPEKLGLGKPWSIVDPGVSAKPYPCGSLGHPTMDAMLALVKDNDIHPEQIARVRVRAGSNVLNPLRYRRPANELEAKFSIPFMIAAIALKRKAGIREFSDEFVSSEPVRKMLERVETVFDEEIEKLGFEKMRSVVEVELTDGRKLSRDSGEYRGGPDLPLSREELHGKFRECAGLVLAAERIEELIERVERLEELSNVKELIET